MRFSLLYDQLAKDYPNGNIWVGTTITGLDCLTDQERLRELEKFDEFETFVSVEPLYCRLDAYSACMLGSHDQIIIGHSSGESCNGNIDDVSHIVNDYRDIDVPVFVKQLHINGKLSKNINDWPEKLMVRELSWQK
jgi:protein gp37